MVLQKDAEKTLDRNVSNDYVLYEVETKKHIVNIIRKKELAFLVLFYVGSALHWLEKISGLIARN